MKALTSLQIRSKKPQSAGFTLIEIMLVVAILALLASSVVPGITGVFRAGVQSSVRRYAALVKYAYDNAVLTGRVHRIVLDLDKQKWSVEIADAGLLPTEQNVESDTKDKPKDPSQPPVDEDPGFQPAGEHLVEDIPNGTHLVEVSSFRLPKGKSPAKKGIISIYAFPGGFIDEATVKIAEMGKENLQVFDITTKSLTGRIIVKTETMKPQ